MPARGREDVVVNGRFLAKPYGGVPRVGAELLRALAIELPLQVPGWKLPLATPTGIALPLGTPAGILRCSVGFSGRLGEQLAIPLLYPRATLLNFCNATPMLAHKSVVWIHDAHVFDEPKTYPAAYRFWHRAMLAATKFRRFEVVTVSNFARERLTMRGVAPERIRVIYNGGDHILRDRADSAVLATLGLQCKTYVLLVGSPARHKNLPFAIKALLAAREKYHVAVVGLSQGGPYVGALDLPHDPRIVLVPHVTDGQLRALYQHAAAVVAPSKCEGFGLYAAEAMFAESGPLVLSNRGALPEVGGDAALYFDPTDVLALQAAVSQALEPSVAARLRTSARIQREKFTWRRAATEVIENFLTTPAASAAAIDNLDLSA